MKNFFAVQRLRDNGIHSIVAAVERMSEEICGIADNFIFALDISVQTDSVEPYLAPKNSVIAQR